MLCALWCELCALKSENDVPLSQSVSMPHKPQMVRSCRCRAVNICYQSCAQWSPLVLEHVASEYGLRPNRPTVQRMLLDKVQDEQILARIKRVQVFCGGG